jgi:hypothetical protein
MSVQNGSLKMELLEEVSPKKCLCNKAGCSGSIEDCFVNQQHLMSEVPDVAHNIAAPTFCKSLQWEYAVLTEHLNTFAD